MLLPFRSVGPEPAMMSTTGTGRRPAGICVVPNRSPLAVCKRNSSTTADVSTGVIGGTIELLEQPLATSAVAVILSTFAQFTLSGANGLSAGFAKHLACVTMAPI